MNILDVCVYDALAGAAVVWLFVRYLLRRHRMAYRIGDAHEWLRSLFAQSRGFSGAGLAAAVERTVAERMRQEFREAHPRTAAFWEEMAAAQNAACQNQSQLNAQFGQNWASLYNQQHRNNNQRWANLDATGRPREFRY